MISVAASLMLLLSTGWTGTRGADAGIDPPDLLRRALAQYEWRQSCKLEGAAQVRMRGAVPERVVSGARTVSQIVIDGERAAVRSSVLPDVVGDDPNPDERRQPQVAVFLDGKAYEWHEMPDGGQPVMRFEPEGHARAMLTLRGPDQLGPLFGDSLVAGSPEGDNLLHALLADPSLVRLDRSERVGEHVCHVIEGPAPEGGVITLWIDRATNAIVRWRVEKGETDLVRGRSLAEFYPEQHPISLVEEFRLERKNLTADGKIVPRAGQHLVTVAFANGEQQVTEGALTLAHADLNLTTREADELIRVDLPEGSPVAMRPELTGGVAHEWRGGAVVPVTDDQMIAALKADRQAVKTERRGWSRGETDRRSMRPVAWIVGAASAVVVVTVSIVLMWKHSLRGNARV